MFILLLARAQSAIKPIGNQQDLDSQISQIIKNLNNGISQNINVPYDSSIRQNVSDPVIVANVLDKGELKLETSNFTLVKAHLGRDALIEVTGPMILIVTGAKEVFITVSIKNNVVPIVILNTSKLSTLMYTKGSNNSPHISIGHYISGDQELCKIVGNGVSYKATNETSNVLVSGYQATLSSETLHLLGIDLKLQNYQFKFTLSFLVIFAIILGSILVLVIIIVIVCICACGSCRHCGYRGERLNQDASEVEIKI